MVNDKIADIENRELPQTKASEAKVQELEALIENAKTQDLAIATGIEAADEEPSPTLPPPPPPPSPARVYPAPSPHRGGNGGGGGGQASADRSGGAGLSSPFKVGGLVRVPVTYLKKGGLAGLL